MSRLGIHVSCLCTIREFSTPDRHRKSKLLWCRGLGLKWVFKSPTNSRRPRNGVDSPQEEALPYEQAQAYRCENHGHPPPNLSLDGPLTPSGAIIRKRSNTENSAEHHKKACNGKQGVHMKEEKGNASLPHSLLPPRLPFSDGLPLVRDEPIGFEAEIHTGLNHQFPISALP
jgi:hypothetical protein